MTGKCPQKGFKQRAVKKVPCVDRGAVVVKAGKHNQTKAAIGGNIFGSILCGTLAAEPGDAATRQSLKLVMAQGGDMGAVGLPRCLMADALKSLSLKAKKGAGGSLVDYSLFFTGEEKAGKGMSVKAMLVDSIHDSNGSNVVVVCGHAVMPNPRTITSWIGQPVTFTFGKLTGKGLELDGTFVIQRWLKGTKAKSVKAKQAPDTATWIVNGAVG